MICLILPLLIGFGIDCVLGDPHSLPHPVVLIGKTISALECVLRRIFPKTPRGERAAGAVLWLIVAFLAAAVPALLLCLCGRVSPWLRLAVESVMCWQILAAKSLRDESMKVYRELKKDDLEAARYAVSMIVGRDTQVLDATGVAKAAVETVAENTSDGVIAPLIYLAIGGPILGFMYKAINTMDSMVGYKNDKYMYFGRCAAKLDDVVNYIPARISALLMIAVSFLPGKAYDGKGAWRIWRRDRRKHASPNSAQTEAVCAGSLGVQLAGDASYFGKIVKKPTIGDAHRPVEYEDIKRANGLLYRTAILCECLALIGLLWVG